MSASPAHRQVGPPRSGVSQSLSRARTAPRHTLSCAVRASGSSATSCTVRVKSDMGMDSARVLAWERLYDLEAAPDTALRPQATHLDLLTPMGGSDQCTTLEDVVQWASVSAARCADVNLGWRPEAIQPLQGVGRQPLVERLGQVLNSFAAP